MFVHIMYVAMHYIARPGRGESEKERVNYSYWDDSDASLRRRQSPEPGDDVSASVYTV